MSWFATIAPSFTLHAYLFNILSFCYRKMSLHTHSSVTRKLYRSEDLRALFNKSLRLTRKDSSRIPSFIRAPNDRPSSAVCCVFSHLDSDSSSYPQTPKFSVTPKKWFAQIASTEIVWNELTVCSTKCKYCTVLYCAVLVYMSLDYDAVPNAFYTVHTSTAQYSYSK